jgi:hypothetical protein
MGILERPEWTDAYVIADVYLPVLARMGVVAHRGPGWVGGLNTVRARLAASVRSMTKVTCAGFCWTELASSCSIADDVYMHPIRVYFVITGNGWVGKYADSDPAHPYELFFC